MKIEELLSKLHKVKQTGRGHQWVACCPAHDDKNPSMGINVAGDMILLHCFGGCSTDAILGAIGMEFKDLYPENVALYSPPLRRPFHPGQVLQALETEMIIACMIADNLLTGKPLKDDVERLKKCRERIMAANSLANGG